MELVAEEWIDPVSSKGTRLLALATALGGIAAGCASSRPLRAEPPSQASLTTSRNEMAKQRRALRQLRLAKAELGRGNSGAQSGVKGYAADSAEDDLVVRSALATLGPLKEELRGMVITLSGSALFMPRQAQLSAEGRTRLDNVVAVLLATREHNVTIEGRSDSRIIDPQHIDLLQRRADAVRDYIVEHDYRPNLIQARWAGDQPSSANHARAERRDGDHRIEIVVSHDVRASRPQ